MRHLSETQKVQISELQQAIWSLQRTSEHVKKALGHSVFFEEFDLAINDLVLTLEDEITDISSPLTA